MSRCEISVLLSMINAVNEPEQQPEPELEAEVEVAAILAATLPEVGTTSGVISTVCK